MPRTSRELLTLALDLLPEMPGTVEVYAQDGGVFNLMLAAIEGDDQLTARKRTALAEMYRSFVELNASRRPQRPEENGASA